MYIYSDAADVSILFPPVIRPIYDAPDKIIVFTIIQKFTSGNIAVTIYRCFYQNIL